MVAVRSAHLNTAGEFALDQWITSLGIANPQSCERLADTWRYCEEATREHPDAALLLWRGVEMVEILSMLSMDSESLRYHRRIALFARHRQHRIARQQLLQGKNHDADQQQRRYRQQQAFKNQFRHSGFRLLLRHFHTGQAHQSVRPGLKAL